MLDETKRYKKETNKYLDHLPPLQLNRYETSLMRREMDRIGSGKLRMEQLSMKRYEMPGPVPGRLTDISAWSECVANSHSQLQHQCNRIANLQLLQRFGTEGWKVSNTHLSHMLHAAQQDLLSVRKLVQEVNWQRKTAQTTAGDQLNGLQETWSSLVHKNYDIECACLMMQSDIDRLEQSVGNERRE